MSDEEMSLADAGAATAAAADGASTASSSVKAAAPVDAAKVQLTSFAVYKLRGDRIEVLAGASDARYQGNKVQLLAGNAPFHSKAFQKFAPKPAHGMLALYGHRDALDELQFWRAEARKLQAEFAYVTYDVVVGKISPQLVSRQMLRDDPEMGFVNMRRTTSLFQADMLEKFQTFAEGTKPSVEKVAEMAKRPDLYGRLLDEDKDFSNVSVFVMPVADDPEIAGKMRQVAYLRHGATVINIQQGSDHVDLLLPSWVTDEKAARKLRKLEA